jgi:UDP-2,4-diacetamido-2,4,6-trideoxy-beta-L-altropyranose hydrolase
VSDRVFFRLDASSRIGLGHLRRCLVLARACQRRGAAAHFLIRSRDVDLCAQEFPEHGGLHEIPWECSPEEDVRLTLDICRSSGLRTGVIDHYRLGLETQEILQAGGLRWMQFGNRLHTHPLLGVLVHDANPGARPEHYADRVREPAPRFLAGPGFALVAEPFASQRARMTPPRERPVESVLLTFGAGDDRGATLAALGWLEQAGFSARRVVLATSLNPHLPDLRAKAAADPRIELHVDNWHPESLMAGCQLALCAGGTSLHELACLGVPPLIICIADNQWFPARAWQEAEMAGFLGNLDDLRQSAAPSATLRDWLENPAKVAALAARCWQAQDGRGAERMADALIELDQSI